MRSRALASSIGDSEAQRVVGNLGFVAERALDPACAAFAAAELPAVNPGDLSASLRALLGIIPDTYAQQKAAIGQALEHLQPSHPGASPVQAAGTGVEEGRGSHVRIEDQEPVIEGSNNFVSNADELWDTLHDVSVSLLRELCRGRGLSTAGGRGKLVKRLMPVLTMRT